MTAALHARLQAVLPKMKNPEATVPGGRTVTEAVDTNKAKYFAIPSPTTVDVNAALDALAAAIKLPKATTKAKIVSKAWGAAKLKLEALRAYIEITANNDPVNAALIIEAGGCLVKSKGVRSPITFHGAAGPEARSLLISWPAYHGIGTVAYILQWCLDGINWGNDKVAVVTHYLLHGLPAGSTLSFRYKAVYGENIETDWFPTIQVHVA